VVAVDFLGNPCDYDAIAAICDKYGLTLLEDAAQSMGASYKGKMCCSFGTISTTSFFPAKTLGCYGDGGAIFTDNDALADLLRSICVHGKGPGGKYDNIRVGVNSRLDNLQAAILLPKLEAGTGKLPQAATAPPLPGSSFCPLFLPTASTAGISTPFWRQIPPSGSV
jgi:UDP-2-acetamido-2-deoxy-ribo-hexuluronate aminotransferase